MLLPMIIASIVVLSYVVCTPLMLYTLSSVLEAGYPKLRLQVSL